MISLPGYTVTEKIYSGTKSLVYRGYCQSDFAPVVIKILNREYPKFKELIWFKNQYVITKNLNLKGVIKPKALETYRQGLALIMEDFDGVSLSDYLQEKRLPFSDFFPIAIAITKTLEGLYHHRIIHKDIKPQNILINPKTKEVKITDFGISSRLPKETLEISNFNILEGTLAYMSPEQTGRMNRGIDYRTDFYSLGVTFYQLLTGQLPFVSNDPIELVHCHIAKKPKSPMQINPAIPPMLNAIILKLMAKIAEERYQSAAGICHDLEICWHQWQTGKITTFELAQQDLSDRFVIPEKLYGRETEVATLLAAFERVAQGATEMMLVTGHSGIGKTVVVNEIHKPIIRQRGYFIKGKFDQFKREIPFSAFVYAFRSLLNQLLTETDIKLAQWKANILSALGTSGQVIIEVLPELESIIGKQPSVPKLVGNAAQNRFNLFFQKFMGVFTKAEHPLVIFLDDLQWADMASLQLIQLLINETKSGYLLVMGAYRDTEVSGAHPLIITLEAIKKAAQDSHTAIHQITLKPLPLTALNHLVAGTLNCSLERALPLTELVYQKTNGNPFFATQFLKFLYENGLITFNLSPLEIGEIRGGWQCDLAKIRALSVTDDIVEFMGIKLQSLQNLTQECLKFAACIGNQFDLKTLAIVSEKSQAEIVANLWEALQEGLVLPISNLYQLFQDEGNPTASGRENHQTEILESFSPSPVYKFLHDRVQQAAYCLIPDDQKQLTHLKIGQLLLERIPETQREEHLFEIVNQLNYGIELLLDPVQRSELAALNLKAGQKAKSSIAYGAAIQYFSLGRQLLAANSWHTHYELTLSLWVASAEAAYLNADFETMEAFAKIVLENAQTLLDKVKIYEIRLAACTSQVQLQQAVEMGLDILQLLGVNFPQPSTPKDIQRRLEETAALFTDQPIANLIHLPEMVEAEKIAALRILSGLVSPAYIAAPLLLPLIILEMVHLSVVYGNAPLSAFAYGLYGLILSGVLQEIETGYEFGKLALNLVEKLNAHHLKTKINYTVGAHIFYGKHHLKDALILLKSGYGRGLETGDLEMGYSAKEISQYSYFMGEELTEIEKEIAVYSQTLMQLRQTSALNYNNIIHQVVLNLIEPTKNPCLLLGKAYNEETMLPFHLAANDRNGLHYFHLHKMILCYLLKNQDEALKNSIQAEQYLDAVTGMINGPMFYFYDSLVRLSLYQNLSPSEQEQSWLKVSNNQEKLQKWAQHAPMNFLHKFYLVEAERHRILGQTLEAIEAYDHAIQLAQENEYLNEVALGNELAAEFYLAWGKEKIAKTYLIEAYYRYAHWGAKTKVDHLEQQYPKLLTLILSKESANPDLNSTLKRMTKKTLNTTTSSSKQVLDLSSVLKASQAISREIIPDQLISTLMQVVLENAGAEKGVLILQNSEILTVEAITFNQTTEVTILSSMPVDSSPDVPATIINYVHRTGEILVLENSIENHTFAADPYLLKHQPKSVLCMSLKKQGQLMGILYLENNLMTGVFTNHRIEVLELLCSQAAISLENAKLYQNLQKSEARERQKAAQLLQAQEKLLYDAFHDSLTHLRNRAWFINRLSQVIHLSHKNPSWLYAILFIDLDRFKVINDSLGHLVGDELLKKVAERLKNCLIDSESVARLGGDEFAILLEGITHSNEVKTIAANIQANLKEPFQLSRYEVYTEASIGITISTVGYQYPEDVLRDADVAMYRAKAKGQGCYEIFDSSMQARAMERLQLENELRRALEQKEFCLYYQPIISLVTGCLVGFEALVRWYHPIRGVISPDKFIPIAEETGLILPLGWWVFKTACSQLVQWQRTVPEAANLMMNINLSALQLKQPDLVEKIQQFLQELGLEGRFLKLELTESCLLENFQIQSQLLKELKALGLHLCVDDFGTGYSSLSRLHEFPLDTLKIDRLFVSQMNTSAGHAETVQMIVTLAHSLQMDVVAEGIEMPCQLEKLQALGCECVQGYLFSRPVDRDAASGLLLRNWQIGGF